MFPTHSCHWPHPRFFFLSQLVYQPWPRRPWRSRWPRRRRLSKRSSSVRLMTTTRRRVAGERGADGARRGGGGAVERSGGRKGAARLTPLPRRRPC